MDAIEYLKAVLRERFAHFVGGLAGARDAYLESAKSHEVPQDLGPVDNEVALERQKDYERLLNDMRNSPTYSYMGGNVYHRIDHNH